MWNISTQTFSVNQNVLFGQQARRRRFLCYQIIAGSNQTWHPSQSEAWLHCTKQAFELRTDMLPVKSALPDSWRALKGGMLPFKRKTHNSGLWEKKKSKTQKKQIIPGTIIFNVRENLIYISTRGTQNSDSSKRQHAHQRHARFQGPWQQKQQYQKVRNSFLQDRQRGIQGEH